MCTLTYIPLQGDFILASNRDERPGRSPALPPTIKKINGTKVLAPVDGEEGGTWLAVSQAGRIVNLLNGAFGPYNHSPPYRKSRGVVVFESFRFSQLEDFVQQYDFTGIAPFTMVVIEASEAPSVATVIKWDGQGIDRYQQSVDSPSLWCSPALYSRKEERKRQAFLTEWLQQYPITPENLFAFHRYTSPGNQTPSIRMTNNSKQVTTVSTTGVHKKEDMFYMRYKASGHPQDVYQKLQRI